MYATADSPQIALKAIVYATDFSPCSENAGRIASLLARKLGTELVVSHSFLLTQAAMEVEMQTVPAGKSLQRRDLETALSSAAQRFGEGVKQVTQVLLEGDPRERIPVLAQKYAPSMLVMGTSGRGRIERGLVGSVAERILRAHDGPSLAVGPHVHAFDPSGNPFRRILYATDLPPLAAQAATYATGIADAFDAEIDVLHVIHAEDQKHPDRLNKIQSEFDQILEEMASQHDREIRRPKGFVEAGTAHERILEHMRDFSIDLLVLAIRRSTHLWLQARLSGAFQIIAEAQCPVLTVTG
ncbi:MAG: universal stress protein [Acidobacteriota bacterium]